MIVMKGTGSNGVYKDCKVSLKKREEREKKGVRTFYN